MSALLENTPWGVTWIKFQITCFAYSLSLPRPFVHVPGLLLQSTISSQDGLLRGLIGDLAALGFEAPALSGGIILPYYVCTVSDSDPVPAGANGRSHLYSWQIMGLSSMVCGLCFTSPPDSFACCAPCHL